jgi:ribosome maturation factor RimP
MEDKVLKVFSNIVTEIVNENNLLLVEIKADKNYNFKVYIDKTEGNVTIDDCTLISRKVEHRLREVFDNFSLEVSSPGLTSPFKIPEQYKKNIGKEIEVVTLDGKKEKGVLTNLNEDIITLAVKSKKEIKELNIKLENIKRAKLVLKF